MNVATEYVERARARVGHELFTRIAGPDGYAARERIHGTPGPRWFPVGSPIRRVHGDASTFVGGLRALLLQSLHPLAMAGVAGHSGYRGDPWGRLSRTSTFLAYTTFGMEDHAQEMVDRVRATHDRVRGKTSDGRPYQASDPRLLLWVHVAETDSFLRAYRRYGERPLSDHDADEYVRQAGEVARKLGARHVPATVAALNATVHDFRPELEAGPEALDTAKFLLEEPPLTGPARLGYAPLAAGAVALLPPWAREMLEVGGAANGVLGGPAGAVATRAVRWGLGSAEDRERLRAQRALDRPDAAARREPGA